MTQPQQPSPLTARLYKLEYPRSLGTYSTYAEVQAVVDALADAQFPVENTMIVGTDLKLMERVTGRRTWGRVLLNGALSGVWMGLFIGLLLSLISGHALTTILSGILFGVVFFTIWSAIGYAASGGNRDFTSMTATIPMQYELMVEHSHADAARRILLDAGATPPYTPQQGAAGHHAPGSPVVPVAPARPSPHGAPVGASAASPADGRPQYGRPAPSSAPSAGPSASPSGTDTRPRYGQPAGSSGASGYSAQPQGAGGASNQGSQDLGQGQYGQGQGRQDDGSSQPEADQGEYGQRSAYGHAGGSPSYGYSASPSSSAQQTADEKPASPRYGTHSPSAPTADPEQREDESAPPRDPQA